MGAEPDKPDPSEGSGEQTAARPYWEAHRAFYAAMKGYAKGEFDPAPALVEAVFFRLTACSNADGQAFPSASALSSALGVTTRRIRAAIAVLKRLEVLTKERKGGFAPKDSKDNPGRIVYTITPGYRFRYTNRETTGQDRPIDPETTGQDRPIDPAFVESTGQESQKQPDRNRVPYKVDEPRRKEPSTLTRSPGGSPGVSVETARKGSTRKAVKDTNPLEYPPFALFWTTFPTCKHKDAPGRMYPAFQAFQKAEKEHGFNMDNLVTALREAVKQCDDLNFFPAPKTWLESRPWLDGSTPKAPDPEAAKREEQLQKARERLDQETIPE